MLTIYFDVDIFMTVLLINMHFYCSYNVKVSGPLTCYLFYLKSVVLLFSIY